MDVNAVQGAFQSLSFESERMVTSELRPPDAAALFAMYSDAEAMKYRGSAPMTDPDDAAEMIAHQKLINEHQARVRLALRTTADDRLIGTLLLAWYADMPRACEIGFSFGRNFWGRGFGTETVSMVEAQLPTQAPIETLRAWCRKQNAGSIRIFEKAGYQSVEQYQYPQSFLFVKRIKNDAH